MKTRIFLLIGLLLLNCSIANSKETTSPPPAGQNSTINVFSSADLYNITSKWANEFTRLNPQVRINVIKTENPGKPETLSVGAGIGFISGEDYSLLDNPSVWNLVVGRDVIVPVMNGNNPLRTQIEQRGITSQGLLQFYKDPQTQNWGGLLGNAQNTPLHYYFVDDLSVRTGVENFLHNTYPEIKGMPSKTHDEMIAAIKQDPNAFGFCKLIDVINPVNQSMVDNIKLVPIDKNGNGKIDFMEDIYTSLEDFSRGVWIGKYPKALTGTIYSVSLEKPVNNTEVAFLRWVLSDGQNILNSMGYSDLVSSERQTQLDKLRNPEIRLISQENTNNAFLKVVLIVLAALGLTGFFVNRMLRRNRSKNKIMFNSTEKHPGAFDADSVNIPKGLYFDKTHTWAFMESNGFVKLGIDDFLQHTTGLLTRIEMKNTGDKIKKGEHLLTIIQKGKQLNIYAPISGTITACNNKLTTNSSLLNTSPYSDGWVYLVEPANWLLEIQFLSMADKYSTWLKKEFSRLKDFFAVALKSNNPEYALIVLQDGGPLKDNILADLGPEVWEDFQIKFIDTVK